ncbi:MAG: hypothetical protein JNN15_08300, partial [Blastocatellia bacterium]|nr:hypothetical protein [Blastocatellia bacterium]
FSSIKKGKEFPETYTGVADPEPGSDGHKAQHILIKEFSLFLSDLELLFNGQQVKSFDKRMFTVGSGILSCWRNNAIPKFS